MEMNSEDPWAIDSAVDIVEFVNPRAKVKINGPYSLEVTVDPPMEFEFSHIEWL